MWSTPEPLEPDPLPEFPVQAVPEPLRTWIVEVSQHTQTPQDLSALFGLACCSAGIARNVVINAGGWHEEATIYANCPLESGNRKSSVVEQAQAPILELEKEVIKAARPAIASAASHRKILEEALKKAQQDAAKKSDELQQEAIDRAARLAEQLSELPEVPKPSLLMEDCTAENVENLLANGSGRLFLCGAEGGVFDIMAGRCNRGMSNFEVFLKGHSGESLRVGRLSREAIVDRPILTMAYAVQPSVLTAMVARPEFRGRGMLARFLYAMPASPLGSRQVRDVPAVPAHVKSEYRGLIRRLFGIPQAATPHVLTLSPEAQEMMICWREEVERMLAHDGELELMRDWGSKLPGLTARLAATMHCIECDTAEPWLVPVSAQTLAGAIEISRFAIPHASAVLSLMSGADMAEVLADAIAIKQKLSTLKLRTVSERQIQEQHRRRFDGQKERKIKAIKLLETKGWIRHSDQHELVGPGRPTSPLYDVHPLVYSDK